MLESISGISMLEHTIKEIEDDVLANTLKAIAKHFLSSMKDSALNWITAKFNVRQIILQFSTTSAALDLLASDVWEASIFDSKTITDILKKNTQNLTFKELLDLHESTNLTYKKDPKLCDPMHRTKQEIPRSPGNRSSRPTYKTNYKSSNYKNQAYRNYKAPYQSTNYRKENNNNKFKKPVNMVKKFKLDQNQKKGISKNTQGHQKPSSSFRGHKQQY